jgi:catechol 2,3-dioxygenase-like lactoylglutathione lyase family enzyme
MSTDPYNIVYPGSDQYTAQESAAPGCVAIDLGGEPLVKAIDTAYIRFQVPDVQKQKAFLKDFGMLEAQDTGAAVYMRGHNTAPYMYVAETGSEARFLGAGFVVAHEADLQRVSAATGVAVEAVDGPGGGRRVRLLDPDGFGVDLVWGRQRVEPADTRRENLPANSPDKKNRVNRAQRPPLAPSAVERFGHYVLMVSDFQTSWQWYRRYLGLLPTDVQCTPSSHPVLAFCRLDLGAQPADHHSVVLAAGPRATYMHSAFETQDLDAIGQGQQYLKQKGWKHFWGIGRHILGSQLFDYWLDPYGHEVEHYADGDVFDSSWPTHYHLMDRGGLWAWGDDLPAAMKPKPTLKEILQLVFGGAEKRGIMLEMKRAMDRAPRPWLK